MTTFLLRLGMTTWGCAVVLCGVIIFRTANAMPGHQPAMSFGAGVLIGCGLITIIEAVKAES